MTLRVTDLLFRVLLKEKNSQVNICNSRAIREELQDKIELHSMRFHLDKYIIHAIKKELPHGVS